MKVKSRPVRIALSKQQQLNRRRRRYAHDRDELQAFPDELTPAVAAVHEHGGALEVQLLRAQHRRLQAEPRVLEPLAL